MFLGVRMKILFSAKETGGQFSLIEGVMPPGGAGGMHLHANEGESCRFISVAFSATSQLGDCSQGRDRSLATPPIPCGSLRSGSGPHRHSPSRSSRFDFLFESGKRLRRLQPET
jgi:hypothetical protein